MNVYSNVGSPLGSGHSLLQSTRGAKGQIVILTINVMVWSFVGRFLFYFVPSSHTDFESIGHMTWELLS